jgi:hypothetical protein
MANTQQNKTANDKIQGILARYLELRSAETRSLDGPNHLDEDSLNAFVEGALSERVAAPVVAHLSDCTFCRRRTVELARLEMHFAEQDEPVALRDTTSEPVSVSSVLNGILSRIFGSSEAAVFAHEEKTEDENSSDETDTDEKSDQKS